MGHGTACNARPRPVDLWWWILVLQILVEIRCPSLSLHQEFDQADESVD